MRAEEAVTRLIVAVEGPYVRVTFDLVDSVGPTLLNRIDSGLASGFVYEMQLLRDRKHLWDARLATAELAVIATYDPVARTYLVRYELDGKLVDSRAVRGKVELEAAMTHIESLPVFETKGLDTIERHIVAVRAVVGETTALGLFPASKRTEWITSRKFRVPATGR